MSGLSVSDLVQVTVSLTPTGAQPLSFGILMIAGDSSVINGVQRYRTYTSLSSVSDDFGVDAPETLAAELYFGQTPKPNTLMIGRWFRTAAAAELDGGILNSTQQAIALWQSISSGGFNITVDGVAYTLTAINLTAVTNLNGVATAVTAALTTATSTAVCTWNGSNFVITSGTTGTGVKASGTLTFGGQPSNNDTVTVNTKVITFKSSSPGANEVLIGGSATATAANLMAFLLASTDPLLTACTFSRTTTVITVTYGTAGTAGNSIGIAKSGTYPSVSAATLLGGLAASSVSYATAPSSSYTDLSAVMKTTSALAQARIGGYAAETPVEAAAALCTASNLWYGLMFAASTMPTDNQNVAVAANIEAQTPYRVFGVTTQDTDVLSSLVSTDVASLLKAANYNRSCSQYCSTNAYAMASFMGRNFSVDYRQTNTAIAVMYKQEPGVTAETLTEAQAATLRAKNCNVFVDYVNDTSIIQFGVMASGQFFDVIHDTDWLQNAVQTAVYNVLYTSTTKVPQTDSGMNQITGAIAQVMQQGVNNGVIAPGTWNGPSFGQISTGTFLKTGYYIFAQSMASQSQADRAARIAPPIQCAVKLAGAIQTVDILIDVNQ